MDWRRHLSPSLAVAVVVAGLWTGAGCSDDAGGVPGSPGPGGDGGTAGTIEDGGHGGQGGVIEEDAYDPPPDAEPLSEAALASLGAELDGILGSMSAQTHSALLMGADSGQIVYQREPDQLLKPASNTKLFTTAAALAGLGQDHRAVTSVFATAPPSGGVVVGDLVLVGRHDFSWSTQFYADPRFPLDQLAEGIAQQGISQVSGTVQVRGEVLYDGYQFDYYDPAAHRATAATRFRDALAAAGISTAGTSTSAEMDPPAGAVELARWRSLPLLVESSPLNVISHNEFADILSRHLGWELSGDSSYAAGEAAVLDLLSSAAAGSAGVEQLDLSGVNFDDGSGLSHGNRVAARHVVALMQLMAERPEGLGWSRTFSIAGVRGTLAGRMGGADTLGRFFGKSGTLNDTIALSGYLEHRHDGQRYLVSLLMNDVTSAAAARAAHDAVVEALAADLRGLGPRPQAPVLSSVKNDGNGSSITLAWSEVAGADGYLVWRSADGRRWPRSEARWVHANEHRTLTLGGDAGDTLYVRVSAWSAAGPSDPSDVYAARAASVPSTVLLVDGNDRWQAQPAPENSLGGGHDFLRAYAETLGDVAFDSCSNEAVVDGACSLSSYDVVLWALGEESTEQAALDADERAALTAYTEAGGNLLISGAELAWHLGANGDAGEVAFLEDVLRAGYAGDDAATFVARPDSPLLEDGALLGFLTPDAMVVGYADLLDPLGGATSWIHYVGGAGGVGAVRYDGSYRVTYLGFPFESIDGLDDRQIVMDETLAFFAP